MKNYELIAELSKHPAGYEIVFDAYVPEEELNYENDEYHIMSKIDGVDTNGNQIFLY